MLAAQNGNENIARELINAGADANMHNNAGATALEIAQHNKSWTFASELQHAGANG